MSVFRGYFLSTTSHRALNFRSPLSYKELSAVRRRLVEMAFVYSSVYASTKQGTGHAEAVERAMHGMRTRYPRLDAGPEGRS